MKKVLLILAVLLMLCGCGAQKQEETVPETVVDPSTLTIVTPKGAPVLAFYDQIENANYTRVTADAISALWTGDQSPDVLVVDLTSGVKAIENGAEYKLAARLWHYLYGTDYDASLVYEADAQQAAAALASGKASDGSDVDYVFLAQPALFGSLKKNENAKIYADIQEEYKNKSGQDMIQAAVFIKNSVDAATGNAFLEKLQASIEAAIADPTVVESGLSVFKDDEATAQYGFNPTVVVNVFKQKNALGVNAMGLGFKKAIDIKSDIDAFLSIFSINQTSEEIYFK